MDKFVIRGGNPLLGTIRVSGAKNAALPAMAAALLTEEPVILENIPQVRDIETTRKLLAAMGAEVELGYGRAQHRTTICCPQSHQPRSLLRTGQDDARFVAGAGAAGRPLRTRARFASRRLRHRRAADRSPHQGTGTAGREDHAGARIHRSQRRPPKGAEIVFDKITVTGTEDLLMAATLAEGETVMQNCAREPEVADLADLLNKMGAQIEGAGTSTIRVKGVSKLHGAKHRIIPDRIEAATFIIAGALTGGDLNVAGCDPASSRRAAAKTGRSRSEDATHRRLRPRDGRRPRSKPPTSSPKSIPASPPTCRRSTWRWRRRPKGRRSSPKIFSRTASCTRRKWCAWARTSRSKAGAPWCAARSPLSAAAVLASDLRASASLVLAALVAEGETIIDRVYHIDRGYENIEEKLRGVGAQIRRIGEILPKTRRRPSRI